MLEQCDETCGWIAAVVSALAWGSFGVPIKSDASSKCDIDPLVMQTYKSVVYFLCGWIVLLLGQPFAFTRWGILSGLFWVPGATAGIYGIQTIGLAVSVGLWSSISVMTSFTIGIFVFGENVKSVPLACLAIGMMLVGITGMSHFSRLTTAAAVPMDDDGTEMVEFNERESLIVSETSTSIRKNKHVSAEAEGSHSQNDLASIIEPKAPQCASLENELAVHNGGDIVTKGVVLHVFGLTFTRRQLGFLGATTNGLWGGLQLVPLHYARLDDPEAYSGLGYLMSISTGSLMVTCGAWILRFGVSIHRCKSVRGGYNAMPSFHFRSMWFYGLLAGFLYSVGCIGSILSVVYLGQGVGYTLTQSAMLISGLWGILYFKEITGRRKVAMWFVSAIVTVAGLLLLSYEHKGGGVHR